MTRNIRVIVPVIYGAVIAILAISGVSWMPWAAAVGGVLVGLFFVLLGTTRRSGNRAARRSPSAGVSGPPV